MKKLSLIGSLSSFILSIGCFIYYILQQGISRATREVTEAYGGLSVETQLMLKTLSSIFGIVFLILSVGLLFLYFRRRKKV